MIKKLLTLSLVTIVAIATLANDDNTLVAQSITTKAGGQEVKLTIDLKNSVDISDIQFDLYLPEGFSIACDNDDFAMIELNNSRTNVRSHNVDYLEQPDGCMRVMCTSSKGIAFSGSEGGVIDVYINVDRELETGDYTAILKNIVVSNANDTYTSANTSATISILPQQYTVRFMADSVVISEQIGEFGSVIIIPEAPVKEGYTFIGWGDVDETIPAVDVLYIAQYSINKYTVTYYVDNEKYRVDTLEYCTELTTPQPPEKAGYEFIGWGEAENTMPAHNLEYFAEFRLIKKPGDVNIDGKINSTDIVAIYNRIQLGEDSGTPLENADVNEDKKVNSADVVYIYNLIITGK